VPSQEPVVFDYTFILLYNPINSIKITKGENMPKITTKVEISCKICGLICRTREQAKKCEKKGVPSHQFKVGDVFLTSYHGNKDDPTHIADLTEIFKLGAQPNTHVSGYHVDTNEHSRCPHCGKKVANGTGVRSGHFITEEDLKSQIIRKVD